MTIEERAAPKPQRGRRLLVVCVWIAGVVGVVGVLAASLMAGETRGSVLAVVYALVPIPVLWLVFWWLDRVEPEPPRYLWAAFVWGAVPAILISLGLELLVERVFSASTETLAAVVAPLVEESAKGLFLVLTFLRARRVIHDVLDGVVFAGVVGFGFAAVENVLYYAGAWAMVDTFPIDATAAEVQTATFIARGVFSPLAHPLFASALGIGIGLAIARRTKLGAGVVVVAGWVLSVGLHALWNGSVVMFGGWGLLVAYLSLMFYLVALTVIVVVARSRQLRTLRQALDHLALRGWIHPDEVPWLAHFRHRRIARRYARRRRGRDAGRVVRSYQRLATELGFEYDRVMRARAAPGGVARTHAILDQMWALRPDLLLPPPLPRDSRFASQTSRHV